MKQPSISRGVSILAAISFDVFHSITTTICKNPSVNAAALMRSSTGALMGTTAPCNTGAAKTGFLLLGNTVGRIWFRAVPRVFGWPVRVARSNG